MIRTYDIVGFCSLLVVVSVCVGWMVGLVRFVGFCSFLLFLGQLRLQRPSQPEQPQPTTEQHRAPTTTTKTTKTERGTYTEKRSKGEGERMKVAERVRTTG